jgi:hypothetical protein
VSKLRAIQARCGVTEKHAENQMKIQQHLPGLEAKGKRVDCELQ